MTMDSRSVERLQALLQDASASTRMQAALTAGSRPDPTFVGILIDRCAIEPDFTVRDTLTWAITRHDPTQTMPLLLEAARSTPPQARSQALHTLSKVGAPDGWEAITPQTLTDPDDEVARAAWRAAVVLVPRGVEPDLAQTLAAQLGRGDRDVRRSLSRALVSLGEAGAAAVDTALAGDLSDEARTHALATLRMVEDPEEGFDAATFEARRIVALRNAPTIRDTDHGRSAT